MSSVFSVRNCRELEIDVITVGYFVLDAFKHV